MDGQGSISSSQLEAIRSLSKQRLPIQSKHVEALLEYVEQIQREARDKALEEAAQAVENSAWVNGPHSAAIRALKDKGE
jgi:uncharacterized tellurite resistance protein B-like protein